MTLDLDYEFGSGAGRLTPEYLRSIDRPTGAELTIGAVGRLAEATADMRDKFAKQEAKLSQALRDLSYRLDVLEQRFAPPLVIAPANGRWHG
jgi:hypothetical protein